MRERFGQRREGRVQGRTGRAHHHHRHDEQSRRAQAVSDGEGRVAGNRKTFESRMYADQAERQDAEEAHDTCDHEGSEHRFLFADEPAVRQHRIVERIADRLERRHEQQIHAGIEAERTGFEQRHRAVLRHHEKDDQGEEKDENGRLDGVGDDGAAQSALDAVEERQHGEHQRRRHEADLARTTEVAADDGGVAPHLVVEPNHDGQRESGPRKPAVSADEKVDRAACALARTQSIDDQARDRNGEPVSRVSQAADDAVSRPQIRRVRDRLGEDPADEDARGQRPPGGRPPPGVGAMKKTRHRPRSGRRQVHRDPVKQQKAPKVDGHISCETHELFRICLLSPTRAPVTPSAALQSAES